MGFDIGSMMKQAQDMQKKMTEMQEELASRTVEGSAGGGMVVATANGKSELLDIRIEKEVLDSGDTEMLQDLVVAAVNQAMKNSKEMMAGELGKLTGGLKIPGLF